MANHVSELRENWFSESISSVKLFLLCISYFLTSLGEILCRKSRHTVNHFSEHRENWFSEKHILFKRIHLMFNFFCIFHFISIKFCWADLHNNLLSVCNFIKFDKVKGILQ
jgi:hypothetical protein